MVIFDFAEKRMTQLKLRTQIEFNRPKKYTTVRELGKGACGETVLVRDEEMGVDLVIKKYCPIISASSHPKLYSELIGRFRDEARILFQLNHPHIVRVYNYYDYHEFSTSYIVMEHVAGTDIESFVRSNPLSFDSVFEKTISGFEHLESKGILHRDIRPLNLMVTEEGEPKIIDFGFGKQIDFVLGDKSKSISLNWWCETPPEFAQGKYDFQTEIYFVGKLFEHVLIEASLSDSKHAETIRRMCAPSRNARPKSFGEIYNSLNQELVDDVLFDEVQIETYRQFASKLASIFSEIAPGAKYERDAGAIIDRLDELYKKVMLELTLPDPVTICRVFVSGQFRYMKNQSFPVELVGRFIKLLKAVQGTKREIVVANLFTRLDAVKRSEPKFTQDLDDEIPF